MCLPCGKDKAGLPIGLRMIGDCFKEKKSLRAAHAYEKRREAFIRFGSEKKQVVFPEMAKGDAKV